jgi:hypothetical protein
MGNAIMIVGGIIGGLVPIISLVGTVATTAGISA